MCDCTGLGHLSDEACVLLTQTAWAGRRPHTKSLGAVLATRSVLLTPLALLAARAAEVRQ